MTGGGVRLLTLVACFASVRDCHGYTMLDVMAHGAVQSIKNNAGDDVSVLKELLQINENKVMVARSRQKRIIELPKGLVFEIKWNIDVPFQVFTRFATVWQFAILLDELYPAEFLQETVKFPMSQIMNPYIADLVKEVFTDGREQEHELHRKKRATTQEVELLRREQSASRTERESVYSFLEYLLDWTGLPPRACLLRTICEVAEAPFKQELLGDLINTIFRPSKGAHSSSGDDYEEFLRAEKHGYRHGGCHLKFGECQESVFDRMPFYKNNLF